VHELSLARAAAAIVEKHAAGRRVVVVKLRVGRLRQVAPDSLAFSFELVARGTVCEGARLELDVVPVRLACSVCEHRWELVEPPFRCPLCGAAEVEVLSGNELEVESIEIEEEACIART
jgi:hydrogenase nickel incorporation protein HypA/HybF